jgi:hypothetical protein
LDEVFDKVRDEVQARISKLDGQQAQQGVRARITLLHFAIVC